MRYLIILILNLILLSSCSNQEKQSGNLLLQNIPALNLIVSTDRIDTLEGNTCYYVTATLENNKTQILRYYNWTCSWKQNFLIDNTDFEVIPDLCFSNWYYIDTILPLERKKFSLTIKQVHRQTKNGFKLGFTQIDPSIISKDNLLSLPFNQKLSNCYWSNLIATY